MQSMPNENDPVDVRALRYFVEVIRQQSFTRASETLHVTQPTISKMVKQLEEEVGAPLLVRSGHGQQLTDAGRLVYARAKGVLQQMETLSVELDELRHLARGELRLGLPSMVGAAFFPRVLGEYRRRYPRVELKLAEYGGKRMETALLDGDLDLGVGVLPVEEELETLSFVDEKLAVVVPIKSRWSKRDRLELVELAEEPFVLFTEDFKLNDQIREHCRACGFSPDEVGHSGQWDFIAAMVAAGHGIALLPETICRRLDPNQTATIPLASPIIPWRLALMWRRGRVTSFAARAWIDITREILGATPAALSRR